MNRHHDPNPFDEEEVVNPFSVIIFSILSLNYQIFFHFFLRSALVVLSLNNCILFLDLVV